MRYIKEIFMQLGILALYLIRHWYVTVPILILLLCLPHILRWLRVIFSNLLYFIRLMLLCKKKNWTFKLCKRGLKIGDGNKTIRVHFLWRNLCRKNLYLFDQGTAYISKTAIQLLFGKGACLNNFGTGFSGCGYRGINQYESTLKKIHLPETNGEATAIVVNPAPIDVFLLSENSYQATGSGVQVQNKTFYFGKDLLSSISRKEDLNT